MLAVLNYEVVTEAAKLEEATGTQLSWAGKRSPLWLVLSACAGTIALKLLDSLDILPQSGVSPNEQAVLNSAGLLLPLPRLKTIQTLGVKQERKSASTRASFFSWWLVLSSSLFVSHSIAAGWIEGRTTNEHTIVPAICVNLGTLTRLSSRRVRSDMGGNKGAGHPSGRKRLRLPGRVPVPASLDPGVNDFNAREAAQSLLRLPNEILMHVVRHVDGPSLPALRLTCRALRSLCMRERWRAVCFSAPCQVTLNAMLVPLVGHLHRHGVPDSLENVQYVCRQTLPLPASQAGRAECMIWLTNGVVG